MGNYFTCLNSCFHIHEKDVKQHRTYQDHSDDNDINENDDNKINIVKKHSSHIFDVFHITCHNDNDEKESTITEVSTDTKRGFFSYLFEPKLLLQDYLKEYIVWQLHEWKLKIMKPEYTYVIGCTLFSEIFIYVFLYPFIHYEHNSNEYCH
jgi:hypothetical protein